MNTKKVAAVCIAKSLKASGYHKTTPENVPVWNLMKMAEQAWKMGTAAYELETLEAWANGQFYGSFKINDVIEMPGERKAFAVEYMWGSRTCNREAVKFCKGAIKYFEK